jgi:hypothetical protein
VDTLNEENVGSVISVFSMSKIIQTISFLCERETGKDGVGREQESEINRRWSVGDYWKLLGLRKCLLERHLRPYF